MSSILNIIENFNKEMAIDLIIAIVIMAVLDIFSPLFSLIIIKIFNIKRNSNEIRNSAFYTPIKIFFKLTGIYLAILFLKPTFNFTESFINIVTKIYKIAVIITLANSFANSITKKSRFVKTIEEKSTKDFNDNSVKMLVRFIKVIIYIIATFIVFLELDYDLSGLITGLGLGSVVLTLAAQDTIKNLLRWNYNFYG